MCMKIYLVYFIIKNTLKIIFVIYLKKKNITIKQLIEKIKYKGRCFYDKMFHSTTYRK
jgi:hypothetical protein